MRIAVLASGTGTILEALVAADLPIAVVVVDRACGAEDIADGAGIPVERVFRSSFGSDFDRESFTDDVVAALARYDVRLLAMAGYGTVLARSVHEAYPGRILNTHPALLPAFKGWHAVEQALAAGVAETGCTVHVATLAVDDGPILARESVPILPGDTPATLHERIKAVERRLYPAAIRAVLDAGTNGSDVDHDQPGGQGQGQGQGQGEGQGHGHGHRHGQRQGPILEQGRPRA